jgi:hypothetical protein
MCGNEDPQTDPWDLQSGIYEGDRFHPRRSFSGVRDRVGLWTRFSSRDRLCSIFGIVRLAFSALDLIPLLGELRMIEPKFPFRQFFDLAINLPHPLWTKSFDGLLGGNNPMRLTQRIHTHTATPAGLSATVPAVTTGGTTNQPTPSVALATPTDAARNPLNIYSNATPTQNLAPGTVTGSISVGSAGGGQPHANIQPYLAINYIIALQGIFPSRD